MTGMDLAEFLQARIVEDERIAAAVSPDQPSFVVLDDGSRAHIERWDPSRVVDECEAKLRIVAECQENTRPAWGDDGGTAALARQVLRLLALPYADHPDYEEVWRP